MTRTRRTLQKLARLESTPAEIPPSLQEAFSELENLDAMHPSSRGQAFGAMIYPASHEHRARTR